MDDESQHAVPILRAIADAVTRLDQFGYSLFIQRRAPSRGPCRSVATGGSPWKLGSEEFERAYLLGCSVYLDTKKKRVVLFEVIFAWNRDEWFVQSMTEEEDEDRENCGRLLWKSSEYRVRSVSDAVIALEKAIDSLEASVSEPSVAEVLDTMQKQ